MDINRLVPWEQVNRDRNNILGNVFWTGLSLFARRVFLPVKSIGIFLNVSSLFIGVQFVISLVMISSCMAATSEMDYQSDEVKKVILTIFIKVGIFYRIFILCENDLG